MAYAKTNYYALEKYAELFLKSLNNACNMIFFARDKTGGTTGEI